MDSPSIFLCLYIKLSSCWVSLFVDSTNKERGGEKEKESRMESARSERASEQEIGEKVDRWCPRSLRWTPQWFAVCADIYCYQMWILQNPLSLLYSSDYVTQCILCDCQCKEGERRMGRKSTARDRGDSEVKILHSAYQNPLCWCAACQAHSSVVKSWQWGCQTVSMVSHRPDWTGVPTFTTMCRWWVDVEWKNKNVNSPSRRLQHIFLFSFFTQTIQLKL